MVRIQVFLACILVLAPVRPSSSMCPKINSTLVTEKRLEAFKSSFLAKLKLERIPENPTKTINSLRDLPEDIRKSYEDAVNALVESYSGGCSHCSQCRVPGSTEDYYADVFTEVEGGEQHTHYSINSRADNSMLQWIQYIQYTVHTVLAVHTISTRFIIHM